jgi:hypothetical protein
MIATVRYYVEGDETAKVGDIVEYNDRLWFVPFWIETPQIDIEMPARIISTDALSLTQASPEDTVDYQLQVPVQMAALEGRLVGHTLEVIERPEIQRKRRIFFPL